MSTLAPTMQAFFTQRLAGQRHASPHTIASYRDTMRLLLAFAERRLGTRPSNLELEDIDAELVTAFLEHLERERGNGARTRNNRLAAIHSLFRFAAVQHPEHSAAIQRVLAIPPKRFDRALITYLTEPEVDALLAAPDRSTWAGRRDHALLLLAATTGLRASELTGLLTSDVHLGTGAHVSCRGKGRKQRITPLTKNTAKVLRAWLPEHDVDESARCSRPATADRSPATDSNVASPDTLPPRPPHALRSRPSRSRCTCYATPPRCGCCTPAWTAP